MEGVWLVPLKKNYMKSLFRLDTYLYYILSYTNKYFFTLYIIVKTFMTNI